MPDTPPSAAVALAGTPVHPAEPLSSAAMSVEDYARVVQVRTEFVDFLLAPARGQLAAAA